jgi:Tol biopolymer transport system component
MLAAMSLPGGRRAVTGAATVLAAVVAGLALTAAAGGIAAEAPPSRIAYVTSSVAKPESRVWTALANGTEPKPLGPGYQPLISPDGTTVAAGLFGAGLEKGPTLALYPASGGRPATFGNLQAENAVPLAWSPDSRYLAVTLLSTSIKGFARKSGLAILDTSTGSLRTIADGIIYGASFAPDASDPRVVFGRAFSQGINATVNLYMASADGSGLRRITGDDRSLNPVWGPTYIAYDRERVRRNNAPVYQLWLRRVEGGAPRRLTSIRVRSLVSGLMPLGFSADGSRLVAEFVGQDTSEAWTVQVPSGRARPVRVKHQPVVGGAISRDGSRLLVSEGTLEGPADGDSVVTVPFTGGAPTLLVAHAAQASWNE